MATGNQPNAQAVHGLDLRVVALSTLASVLGWVVSHAFGGGPVATGICTAVLPSITAFVTYPAPRAVHRVRRVTFVLLFTGLVATCRKAVGKVRTTARIPSAKPHDLGGQVGGISAQAGASAGNIPVSAATAHLTHAWLRRVALTAAISVTPAAVAITAHELIGGQAFSASGPTVRVPDGVDARVAGNRTTTRVTYRVTAADDAGNPLAPKCHPPSGARFTLGTTPVMCSATDAAGRRAEGHFVVTVRRGGDPQPPDDKQPVLTVPDDFTHDATTADGARVTYAASARDARDGALTPDCLPTSGSLFALGRTRVVCAATDASGNTARAIFTVTVVRAGAADLTPPVITVPDTIKTPATSNDGATVTYDVSATDNRDGSLKPKCDPRSGSVFPALRGYSGVKSCDLLVREAECDRAAGEVDERERGVG